MYPKLNIMNLQEAKALAIELMNKYELIANRWYFEFDNSVKRFGCCNFRDKRISLSKQLVERAPYDAVKDTILHEIAHALAGRGQGHNIVWKRVCVSIGAKPQRCYDSKESGIEPIELKWSATCDACGTVYNKARLVRPHAKRSCRCQTGKSWDDRVLLQYKQN